MMRDVRAKIWSTKSAALAHRAVAGLTLLGVSTFAWPGIAQAKDASTTINAYVGLAESYKVECTRDVHFGVHRVRLADPDGDVTIELSGTVESWDNPNLNYVGNESAGISLVEGSFFDKPQLGVCEVIGAPGIQSGTISFKQGTVEQTTIIGFNGVATADEYQFGELSGPTNAINSMLGELWLDDTTVEVDDMRNATEENKLAAAIGGAVQVPAGLVAGNLGGYKAFGAGQDGAIKLWVDF